MKSLIRIAVGTRRQAFLSAGVAAALLLGANLQAAATAVGPFTGDLSETWESFNDYLTGPRYLTNPTGIMGGGAFISNSFMSVYLTNSARSFGLGSSGNAGVADGTKGMGLNDFAQTATITFVNPVVDFGAYWGANTPPAPATVSLNFSDGSFETFTYFASNRSGTLEWHGWHFTTAITSISYSGDFVVVDGLQANVVPEPTAAGLLVLAAVSFGLRTASSRKMSACGKTGNGISARSPPADKAG